MVQIAPKYGYHPNPTKTWLLVTEENEDWAAKVFDKSGINISTSGKLELH